MSLDRPAPRAHLAEDAVSVAVLAAMVLVPLFEIFARSTLGRGITGAIPLVEHLTLWVALLGALLAARSDRLLALVTTEILSERALRIVRPFTAGAGLVVCIALAAAGVELVLVQREFGGTVALSIPLWWILSLLPIVFVGIGLRLAWRAGTAAPVRVGVVAAATAVFAGMAALPAFPSPAWLVPALLVLAAATLLGMPIFAGIGGLALLLFWHEGIPVASVPEETYRLAASPLLPAIPLFTLAGFVLSEGGSSRRLLRLLTASFGWMPGGLAVATVVLLAFFTPLTGASGVTILSMGGLLLPVLVRARYRERFSIGLVTTSGSIGLLLPPSLPVILYGVTANLSIVELFAGGLLPGILLIVAVALWGVRAGVVGESVRAPFDGREAVAAAWGAKWEILLPIVVLAGYFGGAMTLVEAAALAALGALVVECFIHRELSPTRDLPRIMVECTTLTGGFLIILGVALGLTNYLVLAEVPMLMLDFVQAHISSPIVFLLVLNLFLLAVGGLMDIYSAIFVVAPLVIPMAGAYGIDPVHLAVIFLANLELGYLTPPMGENLFLSAYRFKKPLSVLFRSIVPFWIILLIGVLLITYIPALTLGPMRLLTR